MHTPGHDPSAVADHSKRPDRIIDLCSMVGDHSAHDLIEPILRETEEHLDWLETQLSLIVAITLANYLTEQMGEGEEEDQARTSNSRRRW
jgi:bacterioferritin (cytochrome b1)